ncbi:hypothetical protein F8S13_01510 [Chloroflexia bacterium SDU3-3]|nr:hypothetical protein F8S13_01510 [Chloroflexia bacterium SDU3-3]
MGTLSHPTARKARSAALLFLVPLLAGCATVAMGSPLAAATAVATVPPSPTVVPTAPATSAESAFYWYVLDANGKPARGLACLNVPSGNVWVCEQSSGEKVYFSPAVPLMVSSEPVN